MQIRPYGSRNTFSTTPHEAVEKVSALVHSPTVEGWQAKPDGVVVKVLNNVTPIDLLAQSAVLFFNSPTCPPVMRHACTNEIVHHPIYGN